ncbi:MAG: lamin tail domain-containing protein [Cyclobacteriaceae bacterium]|nr:lamin tail domain-containing protein [Cyclobacteriaceae bacterium]
MKKLFIIPTIIFSLSGYSQVADTFSDGDLTNSPTWTPDLADNWVVVNNQLRSNSSVASSSFYITTPSAKATNGQWEFWVNLQFNTSSTNYVDIYLTSELSNLSSATNNGYFVRIGGTPDEISLYKMTAGVASILINGTDGITNSSNSTVRIKVIRDVNNFWTLERDATGGTNYFMEGGVTDNTFTTSNFFGIRIVQSTASFFNRHFFDDIYAGEIILDTEPPLLQQLHVLSNTQLSLLFNEMLSPSTAQDVSHYTATNGLGNPLTANLQPDEKTVILTFAQTFSNGITNQLTISGVADLVGNSVTSIAQSFFFFQPQPVGSKDIIITEIFADPSPQVGLPDAEFMELYNRSSNAIDLAGWKLSDGSSVAVFPTRIVLPGEYWIVCANATMPLFTPFGKTVGVPNFPTLNNSSDVLTLRTPTNQTIDSVSYTLSWYKDLDKQEGGWTIELIDLNNPCGEENNWVASEDAKGGTPGKVNSVNANKPDLTGPRLISIAAILATELQLTFDEKLEKPLAGVLFEINPAVTIGQVQFTSSSLREIKLNLTEPLTPRQLYSIEVKNLRDCAGNFIQQEFSKLNFALPEAAAPGDVLLNEILFNPWPGGVDFVEIVNISDKFINLKNWSVANRPEEVILNSRIITSQDFILPPGSFLVCTSDGVILKNHYPNSVDKNFLKTPIPSMNDDAGSIALVSPEGTLMDYFLYLDDYHTPLLKDKEGVSLERISLTEINTPSNWKSANSSVGFATPGYLNSNTRPENSIDENAVHVVPEIFSPHVPGQDFAQINFRFDRSGLIAQIKIVDLQGRVIKELANNATLALDGFYRWDGDRTEGDKARMGHYFVWFEVLDLDGTVKTFRKRVVIGH